MLLAIDIGNTNLNFGIFHNAELQFTFRLTTNLPRTSNEFGEAIVEVLTRHNIRESQIHDVIIASVVPKVMYSLVSGIKNILAARRMSSETIQKVGYRWRPQIQAKSALTVL